MNNRNNWKKTLESANRSLAGKAEISVTTDEDDYYSVYIKYSDDRIENYAFGMREDELDDTILDASQRASTDKVLDLVSSYFSLTAAEKDRFLKEIED